MADSRVNFLAENPDGLDAIDATDLINTAPIPATDISADFVWNVRGTRGPECSIERTEQGVVDVLDPGPYLGVPSVTLKDRTLPPVALTIPAFSDRLTIRQAEGVQRLKQGGKSGELETFQDFLLRITAKQRAKLELTEKRLRYHALLGKAETKAGVIYENVAEKLGLAPVEVTQAKNAANFNPIHFFADEHQKMLDGAKTGFAAPAVAYATDEDYKFFTRHAKVEDAYKLWGQSALARGIDINTLAKEGFPICENVILKRVTDQILPSGQKLFNLPGTIMAPLHPEWAQTRQAPRPDTLFGDQEGIRYYVLFKNLDYNEGVEVLVWMAQINYVRDPSMTRVLKLT